MTLGYFISKILIYFYIQYIEKLTKTMLQNWKWNSCFKSFEFEETYLKTVIAFNFTSLKFDNLEVSEYKFKDLFQ